MSLKYKCFLLSVANISLHKTWSSQTLFILIASEPEFILMSSTI